MKVFDVAIFHFITEITGLLWFTLVLGIELMANTV